MTDTTVVVPTLGRPSLAVLLEALASGTRRPDHPVVVSMTPPFVVILGLI